MFNNYKNKIRLSHLLILIAALIIYSCKKADVIGEDPYAGGKQPLGITFDNALPDPELATQGSVVTVFVRGVKKYESDYKFFVNEIEAKVLNLTDSTARIQVPDNASTGGLSIVTKEQTFFGPVLKIEGKVTIDDSFISNGASYRDNTGNTITTSIYDIVGLANGNSIVAGGFNNFDNRWTEKVPNGGLAQIDLNGAYVAPVSNDASSITFGKGVNGAVTSAIRLTTGVNSGKFIISGLFSSFNSTRSNRNNINCITRLNANGTLDSTIIDVVNPTPNEVNKNRDTIPTFNGGVDGVISKSFVYGDRLYVVGSFKNYVRRFYERSTYDTKRFDLIKMNQMACLKINQSNPVDEGDLDLTFHYNPSTKQSPAGGNGSVIDAIQQPDGKLVLVGSFTTFNGVTANHIVRINLDGTIDPSFNVGVGADGDIVSITYNATTGKILVTGLFKNFGGTAKQGLAMIDPNGSLTSTFNFGAITLGIPTFAGQLNNGRIIVSGSFKTYNGIIRQGFMILNPDGSLAPGYNNTGQFIGTIYKMIEATSGTNTKVTLVGYISRFDNRSFKSILRITLKN
jgi:phosphohistidine swiveling domain-containing protein